MINSCRGEVKGGCKRSCPSHHEITLRTAQDLELLHDNLQKVVISNKFFGPPQRGPTWKQRLTLLTQLGTMDHLETLHVDEDFCGLFLFCSVQRLPLLLGNPGSKMVLMWSGCLMGEIVSGSDTCGHLHVHLGMRTRICLGRGVILKRNGRRFRKRGGERLPNVEIPRSASATEAHVAYR